VVHSNYWPILYPFRAIRQFQLKNANFANCGICRTLGLPYPLGCYPSNFVTAFGFQESQWRPFQMVKNMDDMYNPFDTLPPLDSRTMNSIQCIARRLDDARLVWWHPKSNCLLFKSYLFSVSMSAFVSFYSVADERHLQ